MSSKLISQRYLLAFQGISVFIQQLGLSIFFPFLRQHFTFGEIAFQSAVNYAIPILILPLIRGFRTRAMIVAATVIASLRLVYASGIDRPFELYVYAAIAGFTLVLFWIPYEMLYFQEHNVNTHGQRSASYFAMFAIASIVAPVIAGVTADRWGYSPVFLGSAALMIIPFFLSLRMPAIRIPITLAQSLRHLHGVIPLLIFDGFFFSIPQSLVGLSLLTFTKTATQFGVANSVAAIGALVMSLVVARASDRQQDRKRSVYVASILFVVILIGMGMQHSVVPFTILLLLFTSLKTMIQPVINAIPMDLRDDHAKLYMGRQFLISVGRVVGFVLTWFFALTFGLFPMYIVYAAGYLFYMLVVKKALQVPGISTKSTPPLDALNAA